MRAHHSELRELLKKGATYQELTDWLEAEYGIQRSLQSVWKFMRRMEREQKKKPKMNQELTEFKTAREDDLSLPFNPPSIIRNRRNPGAL